MRIETATINHAWGRADADGVLHLHESMREAHVLTGYQFAECNVDGAVVAVFLDATPPEAVRARIAGNRPARTTAVIYATAAGVTPDAIATLEAELGAGAAAPEVCAFAVACVASSAGAFTIDPIKYVVRIAGAGAFEVTMTFDWDTESRRGDAIGVAAAQEPS